MSETSFTGFPERTITFLEDLRDHNDRDWFEEHRQDYEESFVVPGRAFADDMAARLNALIPHEAGSDIVGSPFRIFRDVRFSKDKRPYKDHLGISFVSAGGSKMESPGFYFHLEPPELMLGAGLHSFPKELLPAYQEAVLDPEQGDKLRRIVETLEADGVYQVWGEGYKRVPRGLPVDHPNARFLLHKGVYASLQEPIPAELFTPEFLDYAEEHYKAMLPLLGWLAHLQGRAAQTAAR